MRGTSWRVTSLLTPCGILAGCGVFGLGVVCTPDGQECAPAIEWEIGFCLPGDEERYPACEDETTPPEDNGEPLSPYVLLDEINFRYETNYGISITGVAFTGEVQLYDDGVFVNSYVTPFISSGDSQYIANPAQLASSIEADATSVESFYTLRIAPPPINITTGAPEGATVFLNSTVEFDGTALNSASMAYEAGPNGGLPYVNDSIGGT